MKIYWIKDFTFRWMHQLSSEDVKTLSRWILPLWLFLISSSFMLWFFCTTILVLFKGNDSDISCRCSVVYGWKVKIRGWCMSFIHDALFGMTPLLWYVHEIYGSVETNVFCNISTLLPLILWYVHGMGHNSLDIWERVIERKKFLCCLNCECWLGTICLAWDASLEDYNLFNVLKSK